MKMRESEFKELLIRLYPDVKLLADRNLGKAAEATALHCFVYGYVGAGDAKILKDILKEYDKTGSLNVD